MTTRLGSDPYPHWLLDDSEIEDTFGYGERAVKFLHALGHGKAADGRFRLERFQERIIRRIFGPCNPDGTRKVKTAILLLPRGSRKTTLSAAIGLLTAFGPERVNGGEIITAAADKKQARLNYEEAACVIEATPGIKAIAGIQQYRNRIVNTKRKSFIESISSDAPTQLGRTPYTVLADEVLAWPNDKLFSVLRSGLIKVPNSLLVITTTAGRGQDSLAWSLIDDARKIARGEVEDESILPVLLETPADADWKDEAVWRRVNLGLDCDPPFPDIAGMRQMAKEAERRPEAREAFQSYNLNVWLDKTTTPFIEMSELTSSANSRPFDPAELEGRLAWIGLDCSTTTDLTAVVTAVEGDDGELFIINDAFCPGDNVRRRSDVDGAPYERWRAEGLLTATPGNVIDFAAVEARIRELCGMFDVQEVAADSAYSRPVTLPLIDSGITVVEVRQGFITQGPALNLLERAILSGNFRHNGNELLLWAFGNVEIERDAAGNRKIAKQRSRDRVDPVSAAWMAVSRAMSGETKPRSIYELDGLDVEDFVL